MSPWPLSALFVTADDCTGGSGLSDSCDIVDKNINAKSAQFIPSRRCTCFWVRVTMRPFLLVMFSHVRCFVSSLVTNSGKLLLHRRTILATCTRLTSLVDLH